MAALDPFLAAALETNRRGALTDAQRNGFGALAASNHRSAFGTAGFLIAGAAIVYFFAATDRSLALRAFLIFGGVVLAAVVAGRAVTGADTLSRDLREGRVGRDGGRGLRRSTHHRV